eukprot:7554553-Heterocapsa_arctica.AAC.1
MPLQGIVEANARGDLDDLLHQVVLVVMAVLMESRAAHLDDVHAHLDHQVPVVLHRTRRGLSLRQDI